MPSRSERLADARETLRRRFGEEREAPRHPSHRLRDLGSAHPLFSGTRIVSGEAIEADLESDITTINPPILQGWAYLLLPLVGLSMFLGLLAMDREPSDALTGLALLAGGPVVWFCLIGAWGVVERGLVLDADGIWVRGWTQGWLRRSGIPVGLPGTVHVRRGDKNQLALEGPVGRVTVSLRWWPSSALADLHDELPLWGVTAELGEHPGRRHRRHRRERSS
jgi:hypothetical protein